MRWSLTIAAALLTGCLYTGELATPVPVNDNPEIFNIYPSPDGTVYLDDDGQLFEVWATDPDPEDLGALSLSWYLGSALLGQGAKLVVTRSQLPSEDAISQIRLRVQDPKGARARDVVWNVEAAPTSAGLP